MAALMAAATGAGPARAAAEAPPAAMAAVQETTRLAPFDAAHWTLSGADLAFVDNAGKPELRMREGVATLAAPPFATGTVSYDVEFSGVTVNTPLFTGLRFHAQSPRDYEFLYLRPHRSGEPDAMQYTPVFNGGGGWQIYYGPEYLADQAFKFGGRNHVEVRIYPDCADVFVNGEPTLRIRDLKTGRLAGGLGLEASVGSRRHYAQVIYSNFRYTPAPLARSADMPPPDQVHMAGLVRAWSVSAAMGEADAFGRAARGAWDGMAWTPLQTETNGVANLNRAATRTKAQPAVIARFEVTADKAGPRLMRFGYSDKARIFVNGQLAFEGDASFMVRDRQFQGVVGFHDAVNVPLRRGRNEIAFVVSEDFGGWAAAAAFADAAGLGGAALGGPG